MTPPVSSSSQRWGCDAENGQALLHAHAAATAPAVHVMFEQPGTPAFDADKVASGRFEGFDAVRVFAALTVIWHHSLRTPGGHYEMAYGTWGTSFFNLLAAFVLVLSIHRKPERSLLMLARDRFERLYIPFLVWTCVALAFRIPNYLVFGRGTGWRPTLHVFWHGSTYHLWFLPYLLAVSIITAPVLMWSMRSKSRMYACALVMAVLGTLGVTLLTLPAKEMFSRPGYPPIIVGHLCFRYPQFLIGCALGLLVIAHPAVVCWARVALRVTMVVAIASVLGRQLGVFQPVLIRVGALAGFAVGLGLSGLRIPTVLLRLGRLSFGVYLIHYVFVEGGNSVLSAWGGMNGVARDLTLFTFASAASFTAVFLIKRARYLAWMLP